MAGRMLKSRTPMAFSRYSVFPYVGLAASLALFLSGCGRPSQSDTLTIATAANMQFAMKELVDRFSAATGITCNLTISSSGKLTAQIREGAPFDLFVSADMKYPETLHREGLAEKPPKVYAYGKLVLWTLSDTLEPALPGLTDPAVRHIAVANPETAPYGAAAVEVLRHYGLYESVQEKLVFGESIAQTNQFIVSRAAEIGFTAMAAVRSPEMQGKGRWKEVDADTYAPIAQGVLLLKGVSRKQEGALAFYEYLSSAEAAGILEKYGYSTHEQIVRKD